MTKTPINDPVASLEEKVSLLNGCGLWKTRADYRLDVPELILTDGTHGVRYAPIQVEGGLGATQELRAFVAVVTQSSAGSAPDSTAATPATCFPNGSTLGCSWDPALLEEIGRALATECRELGVDVLLGPGVNIRRTPLAGRSYEYYSEDPLLTGTLGAGLVRGMQAMGVSACVKHFACNNSEVERTSMSSDVSERALREVYLNAFERVIALSKPWSIMTAYNRVNGVPVAESSYLLTQILREEWGYDGLVMSDWHGIKDRVASMRAGNDLDMPESATRTKALLDAATTDETIPPFVDASFERMLSFINRIKRVQASAAYKCDLEAHHRLARKAASASIVMLKNDGVLPLERSLRSIAIVGSGAVTPSIQGSGSATVQPTRMETPLREMKRFLPTADFLVETGNEDLEALIDRLADRDLVVAFVGTEVRADGEGADRKHLGLCDVDERLLGAISAAGIRPVVVLATSDAVLMPWLNETSAVLCAFFGGQAVAGAASDILFGEINPSGKLSVTFPKRVEDIPGWLSYPGENGHHAYVEGRYVGYRGYDARGVEPLFSFGFGLSYSRFDYNNLTVETTGASQSPGLLVTFDVHNASEVEGAEVAQIYLRRKSPLTGLLGNALAGYVKVHIGAGEIARCKVAIDPRDLLLFDPSANAWVFDTSCIDVLVGRSSRDLVLAQTVDLDPIQLPVPCFTKDDQPVKLLTHQAAQKKIKEFLEARPTLTASDAEAMMGELPNSIFGIYTSFTTLIDPTITDAEVDHLIESINAATQGSRAERPRQTLVGSTN